MIEAKPAGYALTTWSCRPRSTRPVSRRVNPPVQPLPSSTNHRSRTCFTNRLDPDPKPRAISANLLHIHRPETLADRIGAEPLDDWVKPLHVNESGLYTAAEDTRPASFRARITTMPPLEHGPSTRTRSRR